MSLINDTNKISSDVSSSILGELGSMGLPMSTASQRLGHYSSLLNRDAMLSQQRLDYLQSVYNERMKQLKDAINQQVLADSIKGISDIIGKYYGTRQPTTTTDTGTYPVAQNKFDVIGNPNLQGYAPKQMELMNYMYGQGGYNANTQNEKGEALNTNQAQNTVGEQQLTTSKSNIQLESADASPDSIPIIKGQGRGASANLTNASQTTIQPISRALGSAGGQGVDTAKIQNASPNKNPSFWNRLWQGYNNLGTTEKVEFGGAVVTLAGLIGTVGYMTVHDILAHYRAKKLNQPNYDYYLWDWGNSDYGDKASQFNNLLKTFPIY
jgi:hypothetical protein